MPQIPGRALAKLHIVPYSAADFSAGSRVPGVKFWAMYNPTTFTMSREQELIPKYTAGKALGNLEYLFTPNRTLSIELFIDGTGTSPPLGVPVGSLFGLIGGTKPNSGNSAASVLLQAGLTAAASAFTVNAYVDYFLNTVSATGPAINSDQPPSPQPDNNKGTHNPNFLKIVWGLGLRFFCQLYKADVSYTLFNQLGQPLRAKISATFLEVPGGQHRLESPDLTKIYVVKAGDTIFNIAQKEYDSESFYLQIAQANDLKNYRKLVPGQTLVLPPIAKTE